MTFYYLTVFIFFTHFISFDQNSHRAVKKEKQTEAKFHCYRIVCLRQLTVIWGSSAGESV